MKSKRLVPVLAVAAFLIWAVIIFRFVDLQHCKTENPVTGKQAAVQETEECYVLRPDYRDPFLGKRRGGKERLRKLPEPQAKADTSGPGFRIIAKIKKGKKDFLIIDRGNNRELVLPHQKIDGFSIRQLTKEAVVLSKSGRRYVLAIGQ